MDDRHEARSRPLSPPPGSWSCRSGSTRYCATGRRVRFLRTVAIVVVVLASARHSGAQTQTAPPAGSYDTSSWNTIIYPVYVWAPVFGADVRLPEQPATPSEGAGASGPTIPSAKTSGNLNGAAFGGFRVERSRLAVEGTFLWAGMSGSVEVPHVRLHVNTLTFKLLGGFRVLPALYIEGGARRFGVKMTADVLTFPEVTWKPTIWEPVVGATFHPRLTGTIRLVAQGDLGGIGADSHRTASAKATVEWKPTSHLLLSAGWSVLYLTVDGTILTKPVHLEQTLNGPIVALGLVW
jgi:hypothetical protein